MKVIIINKSDETGGAAIVSRRLMEALRSLEIDARMLVMEKHTDSPFIERAGSPMEMRKTFLAERLKIFMSNGMNRDTLFKADTASDGISLYKHRWVNEADIICLNWVNQGMLSMNGLYELIKTGKPIIWTMHDLWCMTGICHHPGICSRFEEKCGLCPLLGIKASPKDLSHTVWKQKKDTYSKGKINFVAVSNWLAEKAAKSSLLSEQHVTVIPNAFPLEEFSLGDGSTDGRFRIVMGAARLDDPVKGLPLMHETFRQLSEKDPELASRTELITFGGVKNPKSLEGIAVKHHHIGKVSGTEALGKIYGNADCVLSTSLYETLPGTLIEGQACGCIPVSFRRGGQADIIEHKVTGWLAEFSENGNDIKGSASDIVEGLQWAAAQGKSIRGELRDSVERKFSSRAVAQQYATLFTNLLTK
ncbi:MAG: glycosyltransferase [Prevotella sp.]|nr:glycosyltransferase [Bacteroides sp.]MCM1366654.1 glycosyltransferase [Prevotella sp.]MCM1437321.1 glycosyltransferase [Prevotella sp.]